MVARYELDCVDCPFHEVVVGDFEDVLAETREHQEAHAAGPTDHFVNVRRLD